MDDQDEATHSLSTWLRQIVDALESRASLPHSRIEWLGGEVFSGDAIAVVFRRRSADGSAPCLGRYFTNVDALPALFTGPGSQPVTDVVSIAGVLYDNEIDEPSRPYHDVPPEEVRAHWAALTPEIDWRIVDGDAPGRTAPARAGA